MTTIARSPDSQLVQQIVQRIVEAVHPLRIIMFGSAARGEMGRDSDLDLMVVMPDGTHRLHTAQFLYGKLGGIMVPTDIVVATTLDLERYGDWPGFVYREVLREGKVIYES
jgi:predicted nucleotidyltransferase